MIKITIPGTVLMITISRLYCYHDFYFNSIICPYCDYEVWLTLGFIRGRLACY